jgi:endonuclease YncB( thermonuclease family)
VQFIGPDARDSKRVRLRFLSYDINAEMVAAGAAWAGPDADAALRDVELKARSAGKGLWAPGELTPVPPWEWRAQQ